MKPAPVFDPQVKRRSFCTRMLRVKTFDLPVREKCMKDDMKDNITDDMTDDIDAIVEMIDAKLSAGTGRLKVSFSEDIGSGVVRESYHHGRCDVGSPWADGSVSNCDVTDRG